MKNIGVVPNIDKDPHLLYTREIVQWLIERECRPFLPDRFSDITDICEYTCEAHQLYGETDLLVALGGDGTMLSEARNAATYEKPIIGINLGTLGYLTDVERADGFQALDKVLRGVYKQEKRMMLEVGASSRNVGGQALIALNDICVSKGLFSKMITIALYINDEYTDTLRADGIIIATPTGSTAYNLSAGGPILKPDGEMIAITPICPHALYTRPWVISANDLITLKITEHADESVLVLDGQNRFPVKNGETITIYRSKYYARTIRTNDQSFYNILRQKLGKC